MGLPERREPTHILTIEVPLHLDDPPHDYSPVKDAVRIGLSVSRAAYAGYICDDAQLSLRERGDAD